ncbi:patatin-like phospholipase family protein [Dechloromonas denitrificans]|uniref:patatin-like phospholipase family protein n=1 Tax=Dechloromonas denitrificans TaxID=281362 RepID=UPI001CF84111|nr:patatin-like phospholipase family protein [Dechloromonas denitrificans]UCV12402.1 patatin-like phospholipase family protein [Dechloromonas denitrificans]
MENRQEDFSPLRRRLLGASLAGGMLASPLDVLAQSGALPEKRRLAVVLGGGSARGFAHIGVIKALEAGGIRPDLIVGCSAGSLIGAFWAAGFSGVQMEELAMRVKDSEIVDLVNGPTQQRGMVTGKSLHAFVNQLLQNRALESLKTPFAAVATQYPGGELAVFNKGDTGFAVRASCSIPGVFIPASLDGQEYLDGGLVSPLPVSTARKLGSDLVVAVDVGGFDPAGDDGHGLYNLLLRSFEIMGQALRKREAADADIVIRPEVSRISSTDFSARRTLIAMGQQAGARLLPVIREKMAMPVRRRG